MKFPNSTLHPFGYYFKIPANISNFFFFAPLLILFSFFISPESFAGEVKKNIGLSINNNSTTLSMEPASPLTSESMRINLYLVNANNTTILADGVLTEYNRLFHDGVTLEDAYKFTNINENLGITRYGAVLAVERRPIILASDTLFLKLWKTTSRSYQFEFITINLDHPGMQAFLEDTYLGTSIALSLTATTKINFSINANAGSSDINRFRIVYREGSAASLLPVTFTSVKAYQLHDQIAIDWKVENEINIEKYEVERSVNGIDFIKVNSIAAGRLSNANNSYSSVDDDPVNGNNFYRIRSVDRDGSGKFSTIVKVTTGKNSASGGSIRIYPNPIKSNIINLRFINQQTGIYQVRLINNFGQVVYSGKLPVNSNDNSQALIINKKLAMGIYQMEIKAPDNTINIQKALVQEYH